MVVALFLLLLALPGITKFCSGDEGFCWGFCIDCKGFEGFGVALSLATFLGAGRQFPVLDKQSSTKIDSHSKLTSTSCIYLCPKRKKKSVSEI